MMMTQNGKLLYISDNAAEYLGHSMEDLLIHGDSVYDIIDKQDHQAIQTELVRSATGPGDDERIFLCRMNVSRNARRQMRFGDQKVVLVQGHYLSFLPLCSRNEPVFLATCTPVAMPETRECVVQGATNVFTSIHSMDMKFMHIDKNGEFHLGFPRAELQGVSWYQLLHWDCMREAQSKHRLITQSEQDRSCILLLRLQRRAGDWLWVHCVLQVKDNMENSQQPVIVCTNQVLSEREASVMRANSWLYHYYMVQSKLQYGLAYEAHAASRMAAAAAAAYYHPHPAAPPPPQVMSPYPHHETNVAPPPPHHPPYHQHQHAPPHTHQPVDYSRHSTPHELPAEEVRTPPHRRSRSLKTSPRSSPVPSGEMLVDHGGGGGGGGGGVVVATPLAGRPRVLVKSMVVDPADMMEQWNPSPPWSDSAALQKVPDIIQQELSPYMTSTPPTPSATPGAAYHTFSFDWTPEQFVPNLRAVTSGPPPDEEQYHMLWPAEHRLFPLQPPPPPRIPPPPPLIRLDPDMAETPPPKDSRDASTSL